MTRLDDFYSMEEKKVLTEFKTQARFTNIVEIHLRFAVITSKISRTDKNI